MRAPDAHSAPSWRTLFVYACGFPGMIVEAREALTTQRGLRPNAFSRIVREYRSLILNQLSRHRKA
jgi:hypothetical protein